MTKTRRILEPEVMDTIEEAITYDEMDHSEVNCRFVDDLLQHPILDGEILDLGTGTGLIPIELCRRCEHYRVLAVDMAASMLDLARNHVEVADLSQQIRFDRADAKNLPYADDRFSLVMSNSILHHLPSPEQAVGEAARVTLPGGRLFFRDLLRPDTMAAIESLVAQYAADESEHARQLFHDSLQAALSLEEIRDMISGCGFSPDEVRATSDRHWTWNTKKTTPA